MKVLEHRDGGCGKKTRFFFFFFSIIEGEKKKKKSKSKVERGKRKLVMNKYPIIHLFSLPPLPIRIIII